MRFFQTGISPKQGLCLLLHQHFPGTQTHFQNAAQFQLDSDVDVWLNVGALNAEQLQVSMRASQSFVGEMIEIGVYTVEQDTAERIG